MIPRQGLRALDVGSLCRQIFEIFRRDGPVPTAQRSWSALLGLVECFFVATGVCGLKVRDGVRIDAGHDRDECREGAGGDIAAPAPTCSILTRDDVATRISGVCDRHVPVHAVAKPDLTARP